MAQLAEQLLPMPEVLGLIQVIGDFLYRTFIKLSTALKRRNKEKKRQGMAHFEKIGK